jgi:hypothetical protein
MLRKCSSCDGTGFKTIETQTMKFVYVGKKYYHYECYVESLILKKKMTREDAIIEAERLYKIKEAEINEMDTKDRFFKLIMTQYGQPLPAYFFTKVNLVTTGKYKSGMPQSITYSELIEMYSNEKMLKKLDKIAFSSNIKKDNRLMWDLAVMFNEYPNYVKAKKRAIKDSSDTQEAINNVNKYKINPSERFKPRREETQTNNKNSVNIDDLVNDILE